MKIRPVGAELFDEDGRTYKHEEANSYKVWEMCRSTRL
jgi:hypothetical protein